MSATVAAQEDGNRYQALREALAITDAQLSQLERGTPRPTRLDSPTLPARRSLTLSIPNPAEETTAWDSILDDAQKQKLAEIRKVLDRSDFAEVAIGLGLVDQQAWPWGALCLYPLGAYASGAYASELRITSSQMEQLEQIQRNARAPLWAEVRQKAIQREKLLNQGVSADAAEVVQLGMETNALEKRIMAKPSRDLALTVLDDAQRAKLKAFENALQLTREAIALGLVRSPGTVDRLCH